MSAPIAVDVQKGTWTLVAEGVSYGIIHQITQSLTYVHTWRDFGTAPPTGDPIDEGIRIAARSIPIRSNRKIDVYLATIEEPGKVRVDIAE